MDSLLLPTLNESATIQAILVAYLFLA